MVMQSRKKQSHGQMSAWELCPPSIEDAQGIHALVSQDPMLETNTQYAYLLLCHHFTNTCVIARQSKQPKQARRILGFVTGYLVQREEDGSSASASATAKQLALFIWQIGVLPQYRSQGLAKQLVMHLLQRQDVSQIQATVAPENAVSRAFFASLARKLKVSIREIDCFLPQHYGKDASATVPQEPLLILGPLATC